MTRANPKLFWILVIAAGLMLLAASLLTRPRRSTSNGTGAGATANPSSRLGRAVDLSSTEALHLMGGGAMALGGFGQFEMRQALTNPVHLTTHARLAAGQKLHTLTTSNASLGQALVALSFQANREVLLVDPPEQHWVGTLGHFDSTVYATRWDVAVAIERLLKTAGWRVVAATDGNLLIVREDRLAELESRGSAPAAPKPPPLPPKPSGKSPPEPAGAFE